MSSALPEPEPFEPISMDNVKEQIGLVQNFFLAKLHANNDKPLVEDDDLPIKQRMPKPRLPPTGKITSPRKRPFKEPGPGKGHPRKKFKMADGEPVRIIEGDSSTNRADNLGDPIKKATEPPKVNGEKMSREPSKTDGSASMTAMAAAPTKPLTNGILPTSNTISEQTATVTPLGKGKGREVNLESGSFPSPESMEAS